MLMFLSKVEGVMVPIYWILTNLSVYSIGVIKYRSRTDFEDALKHLDGDKLDGVRVRVRAVSAIIPFYCS